MNKRYGLLAGLLALSLLVASCVKDDAEATPLREDGHMVTIAICVPGETTLSSRALLTADESAVTEIDVLAFETATNGGGFVHHVRAGKVEIDGNREGTFSVRLPVGTYDLVLTANAAADMDLVLPSFNFVTTINDVQQSLTFTQAGNWPSASPGHRPIPMWAEISGAVIGEGNTITEVNLMRALAKVNVEVTASNFVLTDVQLHHPAEDGYIMPWATSVSGNPPQAHSVSVDVSWSRKSIPHTYSGTAISANACKNEIYTFETPVGDGTVDRGTYLNEGNTFLVVGGQWNGDTGTTWYRINFARQDGTYLPLLRNHSYEVVIRRVPYRGAGSAADAAVEGPANLVAELVVRNEGDMHYYVYDDRFFIGVDDREVTVAASTGSSSFNVRTDYPQGWTAKASDSATDPDAGSAWLTVDAPAAGGIGTEPLGFTFTKNGSPGERVGYIHIIAGDRLDAVVKITQESSIDRIYVTPTGTIATTGETRTVTIEGQFDDIDIRAWDITADALIDDNKVPSNISDGLSRSATLDIPDLWLSGSRTVAFQYYNVQNGDWETIHTDPQGGYDAAVSTDHVPGAAIPGAGYGYKITVTGAVWPQLSVRGVVKGTETVVAPQVTIPAGSGSDNSYTLTVGANPSWDGRQVELQWYKGSSWEPISEGPQAGYEPVVTTSHSAGAAIPGAGQSYTVSATGHRPDIDVRGVVKGTETIVAPKVTVPASGSGSYSLTVQANPSWSSQQVEFQWYKNNQWVAITEGTQGGYDLVVTSTHSPGAAITATGQSFTVNNTGYEPNLNVRGVIKGTETVVAPQVTVPANGSNTLIISANPSWSSRQVELQWYKNNQWVAISEGAQAGYDVNFSCELSGVSLIPGQGETYKVSAWGNYYPNLNLRCAVESGGVYTQIGVVTTITGGSSTQASPATQNVDVPSNIDQPERIVHIQYQRDAANPNSWVTIAKGTQYDWVVLSTGRVVAREDARLNGRTGIVNMTWSQAMGIDTKYDSERFFSSSEGNGYASNSIYSPTHDTGCNAYYEDLSGQSDKGLWHLPTLDEIVECNKNWNILKSHTITFHFYWNSQEYSAGDGGRGDIIDTAYQYTGNGWSRVDQVKKLNDYGHTRCVRDL